MEFGFAIADGVAWLGNTVGIWINMTI
jgi:hypothetical protein